MEKFGISSIDAPEKINIEKNENSFEKLTELMQRMAAEINAMVEKEYGMSPLVNEEGRINMNNFSASEDGGIYEQTVIDDHKKSVYDAQRSHSGSFEKIVQDRYLNTYGIETEEGIVAHYRQEQSKKLSNQAEMAITALLHKILKDRFLVVRSSEIDDYFHGMDNLILDKETGALICAFDEVLENPSDSEKVSPKIQKVQNILSKGGAEVSYGIALTNEKKLVRSHVRHIPVFHLNLKKADLMILTENLGDNFDGAVSDNERRIFTQLVDSIEEQKDRAELIVLSNHLARKFSEMNPSLYAMKEYCEKNEQDIV